MNRWRRKLIALWDVWALWRVYVIILGRSLFWLILTEKNEISNAGKRNIHENCFKRKEIERLNKTFIDWFCGQMHFSNCCLGLAIPVNCLFLGSDGKLPSNSVNKCFTIYLETIFMCISITNNTNFIMEWFRKHNHKRRRVQHLAYWSTSYFLDHPVNTSKILDFLA